MLDEITDEMRLQIFKQTFRRKADMKRMTAVCSGDRELAKKSLVVSALREIADDIENEMRRTPVKTTNQNLIYKCNKVSQKNTEDPHPRNWGFLLS